MKSSRFTHNLLDLLFLSVMRKETFPRQQTKLFSELANRLVYNQEELKDLLRLPFSESAFSDQIDYKSRRYSVEQRECLVDVLREQYAGVQTSEAVTTQLGLLAKPNSFTVTTGHQLSILTGPLYFVIKILHVINLAEQLKVKYPNQHFVPVFWMASEDHDYDEIKTAHLFNQDFTWDTSQTGAVGRMSLEAWSDFIAKIKDLFKNHPEAEIQEVLEVYNGKNLSEATFKLVNKLFEAYGLVVLDADHPALKKSLRPVLEGELNQQLAQKAVESANSKLSEMDLPTQAFAREVNFFHLTEEQRKRIQFEDGQLFVEGHAPKSVQEWMAEFDEHPERFSPNVIVRPMYQEMILPNLCYVGGGGEMAYWLQLKGVFESYEVPFPLIQVRNSLMVIDNGILSKMEQIGWNSAQLFGDLHLLKKEYAVDNADADLNFDELKELQTQMKTSGERIVSQVNPNLKDYWGAEMNKVQKIIDGFEQRMVKAEKSKHEKDLKAMDFVFDRCYPNNGLQERYMNFFQLCSDGEVKRHLDEMKSVIDPFEKDFVVWYR